MSKLIKFEKLKKLTIEIREQTVLLDSNVAEIYGVVAKKINEAVKNNPEKFPNGNILELDKSEWVSLKSKLMTSMKGQGKAVKRIYQKNLCMMSTIQ